ncbi:hypothetical protein, partial [Streptomyces sp. 8K308]|uniref:hypothetical protein n=1 Tax=Streptomyces sp. 8K308 TaxID=2530388 RepID=UPI001A9E30F6
LSRVGDLAGVRLYRRNVFAVTGLPVDALGRAVRRQRQRFEARLAVGERWPGDAGSPLAGSYGEDEVRAAFEEFADPRRRLVDELLWRWGDADLGCGCARSVHAAHDEAVRLHVTALEAEAGRLEVGADALGALWRSAASGWGALLGRTELRAHVVHRMRALDDPRLDEHDAEDFLAGLSRLLVSPLVELAAEPAFEERLAELAAEWTRFAAFSVDLAALFEEAVEERAGRVADGLRQAEEAKDAGRYQDAVAIAREQVVPEYERLNAYGAFVSEWRREQLAHTVAVAINNLAVALLRQHVGGRPTAQQRQTVVELAEKAHDIAPERDEKDIEANLKTVYGLYAGSGRLPGSPPAGETDTGWGCAACLLAALGLVAAIVVGVVVGPAAGLGTGFGTLVLIGAIDKVVEWFRSVR